MPEEVWLFGRASVFGLLVGAGGLACCGGSVGVRALRAFIGPGYTLLYLGDGGALLGCLLIESVYLLLDGGHGLFNILFGRAAGAESSGYGHGDQNRVMAFHAECLLGEIIIAPCTYTAVFS